MVVWLHFGAFLDQMTGKPLLVTAFHRFSQLLTHPLERPLGNVVENKLYLVLGTLIRIFVFNVRRWWVDIKRSECWCLTIGARKLFSVAVRECFALVT